MLLMHCVIHSAKMFPPLEGKCRMGKVADKSATQGQEDSENSRVTVTLRYVDRKRVEEIADAESVNRNDAIRMALATEQFVSRVRREGGNTDQGQRWRDSRGANDSIRGGRLGGYGRRREPGTGGLGPAIIDASSPETKGPYNPDRHREYTRIGLSAGILLLL